MMKMRINALRKELQILLAETAAARPPVLRRSLREDWLYATDLPGICGREGLTACLHRLAEAGWEYMEEQGWIQMRRPCGEPPGDWYDGPFGAEAACCLSLLERHGNRMSAAPEAVQRLLIKAAEEGPRAYGNACAGLHRSWAERLRLGETLPTVSLDYFRRRKE